MARGLLYDLARVNCATTGTGTLTLGSAVSGFLTFALAGVQDGDTVDYGIADPGIGQTASELGRGVYTASGTTLTRTVFKSTASNAALNLSGSAHVFISPAAESLPLFGTSLLDFGAWPGSAIASLAITGQLRITANSIPIVQLAPLATADHTIDEHVVDAPLVMAGNIAAGTGFTIYGRSPSGLILFGKYNVSWSYVI